MTKRKWRDDGLAVVCPLCGVSPDGHPKCPRCSAILMHGQIDPADWVCRNCPWASYDTPAGLLKAKKAAAAFRSEARTEGT